MFLDFIPDLGKGPNQKTHQYAYLRISCVFWFRHFQRPKLKSKSIFLIKCYIIAVRFFWENFIPKNDVQKNRFYIIFSKSDLGGGKYFVRKKKFWKSQTSPITPKFWWKCVRNLFSSLPYYFRPLHLAIMIT